MLSMVSRVSWRFYLEGHEESLAGSNSDCNARVGCNGASKMHAVSAMRRMMLQSAKDQAK